jgi:hypothetical protein
MPLNSTAMSNSSTNRSLSPSSDEGFGHAIAIANDLQSPGPALALPMRYLEGLVSEEVFI